jgi:hypothetical protein
MTRCSISPKIWLLTAIASSLLCFGVLAHADSIEAQCPPAQCTVTSGGDFPPNPQPATGSTDFNPAGYPWSFSFQTGNPLTWTWSDGFENYFATFGTGGSFALTGPEGTFSGVITSGTATQFSNTEVLVDVSFSGQWSDGKFSYGNVVLDYEDNPDLFFSSTLNIYAAPEPGSILLFASGLFGIGGLRWWKKRM